MGTLNFALYASGSTTSPSFPTWGDGVADVNLEWSDTFTFHTTRPGGSDMIAILNVQANDSANYNPPEGSAGMRVYAYLYVPSILASFEDVLFTTKSTNFVQKETLHVTDSQVKRTHK
jgi:hypothetical protein